MRERSLLSPRCRRIAGLCLGAALAPGALAQSDAEVGAELQEVVNQAVQGALAESVRMPPPRSMRVGGSDPFEPTITSSELERMQARLAFDAEQQAILDLLYSGYTEAIDAEGRTMRDSVPPARFDLNSEEGMAKFHELMQQRDEMMKQWRQRRQELTSDFLSNVESLLAPSQEGSWSAYERDLRRRQQLSRPGQVSGENVDLVAVVERLEMSADIRVEIDPILEQYAAEMDAALTERQTALDARREIIGDPGQPRQEGIDRESMQDRQVDVLKAGHAVTQINRRYLETIAGLLDGSTASALRAEFNRSAFPYVFSPTPAEGYLEDVLAMESLSDSQREQVRMIGAEHEEQLAIANDEIVGVEIRAEREQYEILAGIRELPQEEGDQVRMMTFVSSGDDQPMMHMSLGESQEIREARFAALQRKDTLVRETIDRIFGILNPEQQTLAAKPEFNRNQPIFSPTGAQVQEFRLPGGGQGRVMFIGPEGGLPEGAEVSVMVAPGGEATVEIQAEEGAGGDDAEDDEN